MRKSLEILLPGLSLVFGTIIVGCDQSSSTGTSGEVTGHVSPDTATAEALPKTVNQICPIMGGEVASDGGTAEWNGKLIGFCCPGCEPDWEKLSEETKAEKLAAAGTNAEDPGDHTSHDPS